MLVNFEIFKKLYMKTNVLLLVLVSFTVNVFSQKLKTEQGSINNLKGIKSYNLVFDYSNLKVDKFETEEAFLKDKMSKREENGTHEEFKQSWFADRNNRYEPKFIESFNKRFDNGSIKADKNLSSATHEMLITTTWIYPGYNVGVMRQPAKINATITVYDKNNPTDILYKASIQKVEGNGTMGTDYNSGYRISEGYAKLAKILAADLKKAN